MDAILLRVPLGDVPYFVPCDVAGAIALSLADKLPLQRALTRGHMGSRDEHKDVQVFEALQFVASASDPELAFWGCECFSPRRVIVEGGVCGTV
jgi:hypothetical protein